MTDLPENVAEKLQEYFHQRLESLGGCRHFDGRMMDACEAMTDALLASPEFAAITDELRREAVEAAADELLRLRDEQPGLAASEPVAAAPEKEEHYDGVRCELCGVVRNRAMESRDGVVRCQDWITCEQVVALVTGARSTYADLIEAGWLSLEQLLDHDARVRAEARAERDELVRKVRELADDWEAWSKDKLGNPIGSSRTCEVMDYAAGRLRALLPEEEK